MIKEKESATLPGAWDCVAKSGENRQELSSDREARDL
jgi:hypothetical protein